MAKISFKPCEGNLFRFTGMDFKKFLDENISKQRAGKIEEAMDERYKIAINIATCLPDEFDMVLDCLDDNSRNATNVMYISAIDLYMNEDWERSAALLETILDIDSEDCYSAPAILTLCYIMLEDDDCLESIVSDVEVTTTMNIFALSAVDYKNSGTINVRMAEKLKSNHQFTEYLHYGRELWDKYTENSKEDMDVVLAAALARPILKKLEGLETTLLNTKK
ncbi:MAG: hypothetical protein KBS95_01965 [Alistipes sp.]|nr:hypothetical protein [Candidatus Alistipes equi]